MTNQHSNKLIELESKAHALHDLYEIAVAKDDHHTANKCLQNLEEINKEMNKKYN